MKTKIFDDFLAQDCTARAFSSEEIPEDVYHTEKRFISKHALDLFNDCPLKFKAWLDGKLPEETSPALKFGSALHAKILEPDRFADDFMRVPEEFKSRRGKAWEEFSSTYAFKHWLTAEESDKLDAMENALRENEMARDLLFSIEGKNEQTVLFKHRLFENRPCKARLDRTLSNARIIVDLKTCASAHPKAFASAVEKFRYDVQGAFYRQAMAHLQNEESDDYDFAIVAIEKEPPFAVAVYFLSEWTDIGEMTLANDMANLLDAEKTGTWKSYEVPDFELHLPRWTAQNRGF